MPNAIVRAAIKIVFIFVKFSFYPAVCARRWNWLTVHGHKIPWSKQKNRNAPAHGTPRAEKKKFQIRRTQLRAKSGASVMLEEKTVVREIALAGFNGDTQIAAEKMRVEIGFCRAPFCDGSTGAFCGAEFLPEQQGITCPCWQQAGSVFAQGIAAGATNGVVTSATPNNMASTIFTKLSSVRLSHCAKPILAFPCQFLASLAFCASVSLMTFMYLSGSFRNFGLHIEQQNLIS